jgi:hypothetical protein
MSDEQQVDTSGVEQEAKRFGWVPKEDFRGNETDWVDADTFVKRGKEINPILRANNERLKKELDAEREKHTAEIAAIRQTAEEFKQFQKDAFERKQKELSTELEALKAQRKEAIREGDADLVVELEDRIEEVKEERASAKEPTPAPAKVDEPVKVDPSLSEWIDNNKWFGSNQEATQIANALGATINQEFPNLRGKAFLDKLDERLKQRVPELYGNPNQGRNTVEGGGARGNASSSGKKTYDNLPSEAKAACDKFVKQGLFKSKQEYVDLYDWE